MYVWLFDAVQDKHHACGVDNLYMSARFCKDEYMHLNKIKLHGMAQKGGRGLPASVIQDEDFNKKGHEKFVG